MTMDMESILHSEIFEQPQALRRLLAQRGEIEKIARSLRRRHFRFVFIAARGTSDNAARYGQYLFGVLNRLPVALAAPSLLSLYHCPPKLAGALVIGVSQSGQSPDIVGVLEEGRRQGAATVAITNETLSPLANAAEYTIPICAGPERSVAATKTYTTQLAALALLAMGLAGEKGRELEAIPQSMERALETEAAVRRAVEYWGQVNSCVVIGRGYNYATAYEIALKTKELACLEAEPYSSADFKHGPIAMVDTDFPVLVLAVGDAVRGELLELAVQLKQRRARLVLLTDSPGAVGEPGTIQVPALNPEWLSPLTAILPGQLFAYHLALARGLNPDEPHLLRKVTLTR
jgi:glucosamine--fructose-6-phosphate aminotransferase (isomerizing)